LNVKEIADLQKEILMVIEPKDHCIESLLKVVSSHVLNTANGNLNLAVKKAPLNRRETESITTIAKRHNLKVTEIDEYLVISKPEQI
jgi:hypothetical protein